MTFLLGLTLNFALNVSSINYFMAKENDSSIELYYDNGFIELLLFDKECYEQFHIAAPNKTNFTYNWNDKTVDGYPMERYDGNCNITEFDIEEAMIVSKEVLNSIEDSFDYEYLFFLIIPMLLIARSDTIYNRFRSRQLAKVNEPDEYQSLPEISIV